LRASEMFGQILSGQDNDGKGMYMGFECLSHYNPVRGYPLFIAGSPHHGKSEFTKEIAVYMADRYNLLVAIYAGEDGELSDVYGEVCAKYCKKHYKKFHKGRENKFAMTESELSYGMQFVDKHLVAFEQPDSMDSWEYTDYYKMVYDYEKENGVNFDMIITDPHYDFDMPRHCEGQLHTYINWLGKFVRDECKKNNRVDIIVNHISDISLVMDKESQVRYQPKAHPKEWAGGMNWYRRAYGMINVYRVPTIDKFLSEHGREHLNQTDIEIQKAKPKESGTLDTGTIYYDWEKNSYYEIWNMNTSKRYYAGELQKELEGRVEESGRDRQTNDNKDQLPF